MSGQCAACGARAVRQRRRAYISDGPGALRSALVCTSCFGMAISVVTTPPELRCRCGAVAFYCTGCADKQRAKVAGELLGPAIRTLTALRRQHETTLSISATREPLTEDQRVFLRGKIEALDGAIAILETESSARQARSVLTMLTTEPTNDGGETDAS